MPRHADVRIVGRCLWRGQQNQRGPQARPMEARRVSKGALVLIFDRVPAPPSLTRRYFTNSRPSGTSSFSETVLVESLSSVPALPENPQLFEQGHRR
jgi:hypothetical protein